ncbi:hydroxymethylpyrimidine/phosphomethylpyrimidine kinase [Fulvitalea axinellae]|uniref:hydroxymethylpyrimidine kinase n=1 Tax=Fulvitalea axinellae TaxID=1182444 RepID=A0AAU9C8R8_9BACT|nr:hydroxymethylpyrimidine/phosphomethylpyrimidine kinase [Fulvitalea axinellae]
MKKYPKALTIAGSDSGGGAGIQADLKTFSALGCYGMSAITAVTAQNTLGVSAVHPVPPAVVETQINDVLSDIGADAIKIGMLHSAPTVLAVANALEPYPNIPMVLDPVLASSSGRTLIDEEGKIALVEKLAPQITLLTPNLPEAEILLSRNVEEQKDMEGAVGALLERLPCQAILLKGGHLEGQQLMDIFMERGKAPLRFYAKKTDTPNKHGTGCTLSSAVAAYLAKGFSLEDSVKHGHAYLQEAIEAGKDYVTGKGHGPVNHFFGPEKLGEKA